MSELEKFYNRLDEKYAHPELRGIYQMLCTPRDPSEFVEMNDEGRDFGDKVTKYEVKGGGKKPLEVFIAKPNKMRRKTPTLFIIPGGGLFGNSIVSDFFEYAEKLNAIVVCATYRVISDFKESESGYPGTIDDLEEIFKWVLGNSESLGIDPDNITLYGESSGAQLALGFCHRLKKHDYHGYQPRGVVTSATTLDDRLIYASSKYTDIGWSGPAMNNSIHTWLGPSADLESISPEAVPGRATAEECIGLPPTFLHVDENDSGASPVLAYADKLLSAGVYTEVHLWGGSNHHMLFLLEKFDPEGSPYAERAKSILFGELKDCMQYDLRRK